MCYYINHIYDTCNHCTHDLVMCSNPKPQSGLKQRSGQETCAEIRELSDPRKTKQSCWKCENNYPPSPDRKPPADPHVRIRFDIPADGPEDRVHQNVDKQSRAGQNAMAERKTEGPEWVKEDVQAMTREQLRSRWERSRMDPDDPGVFPAIGRNRHNSGL
ncbi:hypothetical protein BDV97DRAFT_42004 [Delphinella strobiligena]|nr:hypothetical protein BDV97DRAFT_42004 [Delphinella strobiligena]